MKAEVTEKGFTVSADSDSLSEVKLFQVWLKGLGNALNRRDVSDLVYVESGEDQLPYEVTFLVPTEAKESAE